MTHYSHLTITNAEGQEVTGNTRIEALNEFRTKGIMHGFFFAPLDGQSTEPEDAYRAGPESPDDVDWHGFPGATTIVCNWSTLDQALVNSDDAEQESFVRAAQVYAEGKGYLFDTIRNIQRPGFYLSSDGETKDDELDDSANRIFEAICETICND